MKLGQMSPYLNLQEYEHHWVLGSLIQVNGLVLCGHKTKAHTQTCHQRNRHVANSCACRSSSVYDQEEMNHV